MEEEEYLLNGSVYTYKELEPYAKKNNVDFNTYVKNVGAVKQSLDYSLNGSNYSKATIEQYAKKNNVSFDEYVNSVGVKKKKYSQSTSQNPKSVSETANGSSVGLDANGFQKIQISPLIDGLGDSEATKLKKKIDVKVTPENMEQVNADTDALLKLQKEKQKEEELLRRNKIKKLENNFYSNINPKEIDVQSEAEANDVINKKGFLNTIEDFARTGYNNVVDALSLTPTNIGLQDFKVNKDATIEHRIKVVEDAKKNNKTLTEQEINNLTKLSIVKEKKEAIYDDKVNSYLDNLPEDDKTLLYQDRAEKSSHLNDENKKLNKVLNAKKSFLETKVSEYKDLESELINLKNKGLEIPKEKYDYYLLSQKDIKSLAKSFESTSEKLQKNKSDLGTVKQEMDMFKRDYGDISGSLKKIGLMSIDLGAGFLAGLDYVATFGGVLDKEGHQETLDDVSNVYKWTEEQRGFIRKSISEVKSIEGFMNYVTDVMSNQAPILLTTVVGGEFGLLGMGVSSAGQKDTEMNQEIQQGKANYSAWQTALVPLFWGASDVVSEKLNLDIFKKSARVLSSIEKNAPDLIRKSATEKTNEFISSVGGGYLKEQGGEHFTNFFQNGLNKFALGKKNVSMLDNVGNTFKDTTVMNGLIGFAPQLAGEVIKEHTSYSDMNTLDENSKKLIAYSKQLNNPELNAVEKEVIEKQITKTNNESSEILKKNIKNINDMPINLYEEVININKQIGNLKIQAEEIKKGSLPSAEKEVILNSLNEEYRELNSKRNDFLSSKTTVVDLLPLKEQETIKKQALESLVTELNPDGKKDMTITDQMITKRANEIYSESNQNKNAKTEISTPEAQPQAEVPQQAEAEKVDVNETKQRIGELERMLASNNESVSKGKGNILVDVELVKSELADLKNKLPKENATAPIDTELENKKADIEKRRKEAHKALEEHPMSIGNNGNYSLPEQIEITINGIKKVDEPRSTKEIDAKYDAELEALKTKAPPVEDVVAPSVVEAETRIENGKELTFYNLDGDNTDSGFAVEKNKDGYVIQSALLPFSKQKQGIGTDFYVRMNNESIEKTGSPLKSSENLSNSGGKPFWEKLVDKGFAEKTKDGFKFKEQPKVEVNEATPPVEDVVAPSVEEFKEIDLDNDAKEVIKNGSSISIKGEQYNYYQLKTYGAGNVFVVEIPNGGEIGRATLNKDGYLENIRINEDFRKKGLGSKMYDYIEKTEGISIKPSPVKQSSEAKALWEKRNRISEVKEKNELQIKEQEVISKEIESIVKNTPKNNTDVEKNVYDIAVKLSGFGEPITVDKIKNSITTIKDKNGDYFANHNEEEIVENLLKRAEVDQLVSKKVNAKGLATILSETIGKTFSDFKNRMSVLKELENIYFNEIGITINEFEKLPNEEQIKIQKESSKWLKDNPEIVKKVEESLKNEKPQEGNSTTNGNVRIEPANVGESGATKQESPVQESVSKPLDGGEGKGDASVGKETKSDKYVEKPVNEIKTDETRFQNRTELDEEQLKSIKDNWNENELDPVVIWKDENGNDFILAGHHRLEASKQLGKETIDARYFKGTEEEAIKYATEKSNANRTMEQAYDRAKKFRQLRESGASKKDIIEFSKGDGKNKKFVENLSYLNPKGKIMDMLKSFGKAGDKETVRLTESAADWIGESRKHYPEFTDAHENELYDYLINKGNLKKIGNKTEFTTRLQKYADAVRLFPEEPLNIEHRGVKGDLEQSKTKEIDVVKTDIKLLEKERDKGTPTETRLKEITKLIEIKNAELGKLNKQLSEAKAGDKMQGDLFDIALNDVVKKINDKQITDEQANEFINGENKPNESIIANIKSKAKNAKRISTEELEKGIADAEKLLNPPTTKQKIAERIKLSDAKLDAKAELVKAKLKAFNDMFPKADINPDEYKTNGFTAEAIVDMVAKAAKSLAKGGIVIDAYIKEAIEAFNLHFEDEVDFDAVKQKINSETEKKEPKVNQSISEKAKKLKISEQEYEELNDMIKDIPESGVIKDYVSGKTITRAYGKPTNAQGYDVKGDDLLRQHGIDVVEKAKKLFGEDYVAKLADYIENSNLNSLEKTIVLSTLQNIMDMRVNLEPNDVAEVELQKYINALSQEQRRIGSLTIRTGRLDAINKIIRDGVDLESLRSGLFTSKQEETKSDIDEVVANAREGMNEQDDIVENEKLDRLKYTQEDFDAELKKAIDNYANNTKEAKTAFEKLKREAFKDKIVQKKEELRDEANDLIEQLRKLARKSIGDISVNPIPIEAIPIIAKLAKVLIKEGALSMQDISSKIHNNIKDVFEGISEKDIVKALLPKGTRVLSTETKRKIYVKLLEKHIEVLDEQIYNKEKPIVNKVDNYAYDLEIQALRELKKAKQKELLEADPTYIERKKQSDYNKNLNAKINDTNKKIKDLEENIEKNNNGKSTVWNAELSKAKNDLKALRELKKAESIGEVVKQALIDAGFSREVTYKGEKVKRLDWKLLAGKKGIVETIKETLKEQGKYSEAQIEQMTDAIKEEYIKLNAKVIENGLKELERKGKITETKKIKSQARLMADFYNFGLFENNRKYYEKAINAVIGLSEVSQKAYDDIESNVKALSFLFNQKDKNGNPLGDVALESVSSQINHHIKSIVSSASTMNGGLGYRFISAMAEFTWHSLKGMLGGLNTILENMVSNKWQGNLTKWSNYKNLTPELKNQIKADKKAIYNDIVQYAGLFYGETGSSLISHTRFDDWINGKVDSKIGNTVVSWITLRKFLEAPDSAVKAQLTQIHFVTNMIDVLTLPLSKNPNGGMTKEQAQQYLNEQLTGDSFKDALATAEKIINKTNELNPKKNLKTNKEAIHRFAMGIVKQNLISAQTMSLEQMEQIFGASYKTAGLSIGHEANNFVSKTANALNALNSTNLEKSLKEGNYLQAAMHQVFSIITKGILMPFAGGGSNWTLIQLSKLGLPIEYVYDRIMKTGTELDLSTPQGRKELKNTLFRKRNVQQSAMRTAVGGLITVAAVTALTKDFGDDDEDKDLLDVLSRKLRGNDLAKKMVNRLLPSSVSFLLHLKEHSLDEYALQQLNMKTDLNDNVLKTVVGIAKGDKPMSKVGGLFGQPFSMPFGIWRTSRDIYNLGLAINGERPIKFYKKNPQTFLEGLLNGGFFQTAKKIIDNKKEKVNTEKTSKSTL